MNARKKEQLLIQVKAHLISKGFREDRFGNYINEEKTCRFKFNKISMSKEISHRNSEGNLRWFRVRSGYYKDLFFEDGKLIGLRS